MAVSNKKVMSKQSWPLPCASQAWPSSLQENRNFSIRDRTALWRTSLRVALQALGHGTPPCLQANIFHRVVPNAAIFFPYYKCYLCWSMCNGFSVHSTNLPLFCEHLVPFSGMPTHPQQSSVACREPRTLSQSFRKYWSLNTSYKWIPVSFLILFTTCTWLIQPHSEHTHYQHYMPWANRNHSKTVIKPLLCRKSNCKVRLHHVPNSTSSVASPSSSPPFSWGWSICPHLGALISHIFIHRIYPSHCVILICFVICKPEQQLHCAVSHCSWAAQTSVFSAASKPTFYPLPGPMARVSTPLLFYVVCILDVSGASFSHALPDKLQSSASHALP